MTEWRAIPGYEGRYEVSDDGQVRSLDRTIMCQGRRRLARGRDLHPSTHDGTYFRFCFKTAGKRKFYFGHALVLLAFVGPCPSGMQTRHIDGNGKNNRLPNLAYGTALENHADMYRHGTRARGQRICTVRLTEQDIPQIRSLVGKSTYVDIATQYSVTPSTIRRIAVGESWTHIPLNATGDV